MHAHTHAHTRTNTHAHTHTRMHARTHARTHARAHAHTLAIRAIFASRLLSGKLTPSASNSRLLQPFACKCSISKEVYISWGHRSVDALQAWSVIELAHWSVFLAPVCADQSPNEPFSEDRVHAWTTGGIQFQLDHSACFYKIMWSPNERPMPGAQCFDLHHVMHVNFQKQLLSKFRGHKTRAMENEVIVCGGPWAFGPMGQEYTFDCFSPINPIPPRRSLLQEFQGYWGGGGGGGVLGLGMST